MSSRRRSALAVGARAVALLACIAVAPPGSIASSAGPTDSTTIPAVPDLPEASPVPAGGYTISPADSQRIAARFERIHRSSSVTIFQVDGWEANCRPWTFPGQRVIDCHPVIQEARAPSKAWSDSMIALLTAPGALIPPRTLLCVCWDDVVLRFESETETTTVWLCTGCATVGIPTPTAVMGFDFAPGPTALRSLVNSALHMREYETRLYFEYYDTSPRLVGRPESPPELRVSPGAPADTVLFEALIGKDGRVRQLRLVRGDARLADLAAPLVNRYEYKPALSRTRPVAAQIHIRVPVPEEAR